MRWRRDRKWVRQHIPKEVKQYPNYPRASVSGRDKQWFSILQSIVEVIVAFVMIGYFIGGST